jgi:hypothetical protein
MAEEKTIIIAANPDGFTNIECIFRAWGFEFVSSRIEGMWIVSERSSTMTNIFSAWEVKNYQISIWDKVN